MKLFCKESAFAFNSMSFYFCIVLPFKPLSIAPRMHTNTFFSWLLLTFCFSRSIIATIFVKNVWETKKKSNAHRTHSTQLLSFFFLFSSSDGITLNSQIASLKQSKAQQINNSVLLLFVVVVEKLTIVSWIIDNPEILVNMQVGLPFCALAEYYQWQCDQIPIFRNCITPSCTRPDWIVVVVAAIAV